MGPLAVAIPVVHRSNQPYNGRGKWPVGRKYDDGPLPTQMSDHAPRNARITGRVADMNGVAYTLKIGEVELTDIGAHEILDYISPLYLEQYENSQFVEEREVLAALEVENQVRNQEKLERQKERARARARTKGTVFFEEIDSAEDVTGAESGDHGRARPTYTHLFKLPKERRRRKRDPQTGELMPLSDDDENGNAGMLSTEEDAVAPRAFGRPPTGFAELPLKRRRRKRDKVTGELLPLSPIAQQTTATSEKKRQRRKRHPLTGELMPIGWRYDPNEDEAIDTDVPASQSFRKLSLAHGHEAKRPRLSSENPQSSSSSSQPIQRGLMSYQLSAHKSDRHAAVDLSSPAKFRSPSKLVPSTPVVVLSDGASLDESSSEPELRTSITRPTARWKASTSPERSTQQRPQPSLHSGKRVTTSLLNPSAPQASSSSAPISDIDVNIDEDEEWEVEGILEHRYSNPDTHPPTFGHVPVMLYRTKWIGSNERTWEPLDSFGDWDIIRDYRRRVGLPSEPSDAGLDEDSEGNTTVQATSSKAQGHSLPGSTRLPMAVAKEIETNTTDSDDGMDDDQFEFEAILSHHLSDPRTHPPELGKTPVMLYQVKWNGWEETTWEPAGSFEDSRMLEEYRRRVGLKPANSIGHQQR